MDSADVTTALAALAQSTRLETFRLLVTREPEGIAAGELARLVAVPQNTLSAHLAVLSRAGLILGERHSRSIIYRADLGRLREVMLFLLKDCCGGRADLCRPLIADLMCCCPSKEPPPMTERVFNVLFLCTGNSARSILAESILRKDGAGRFKAFSAGSKPKGTVNPFALEVLESLDYPTHDLRSKSWKEFAVQGAPVMDFVFTVCDDAAGEACPVWPGQPMAGHWGIEDPAAAEGTDLEKKAAFVRTARCLEKRISAFANLPLASLDKEALTARLRAIGRLAEAAGCGREVA